MLSERVRDRLVNWKFEQALDAYMNEPDDVDQDTLELIAALALTFGNVGGFDGHMSAIVRAAVSTLVSEEA